MFPSFLPGKQDSKGGSERAFTLAKTRQVGVEIPMDSEDADEENQSENGSTLLHIFERGYVLLAKSGSANLVPVMPFHNRRYYPVFSRQKK